MSQLLESNEVDNCELFKLILLLLLGGSVQLSVTLKLKRTRYKYEYIKKYLKKQLNVTYDFFLVPCIMSS